MNQPVLGRKSYACPGTVDCSRNTNPMKEEHYGMDPEYDGVASYSRDPFKDLFLDQSSMQEVTKRGTCMAKLETLREFSPKVVGAPPWEPEIKGVTDAPTPAPTPPTSTTTTT